MLPLVTPLKVKKEGKEGGRVRSATTVGPYMLHGSPVTIISEFRTRGDTFTIIVTGGPVTYG